MQVERQFSRASTSLIPYLFAVLMTKSEVIDVVGSPVPESIVVGLLVVGFNVGLSDVGIGEVGCKVAGFAVGLDMTLLALVGFGDVGIDIGFKVGLVVCGVNGGPAQLFDSLKK